MYTEQDHIISLFNVRILKRTSRFSGVRWSCWCSFIGRCSKSGRYGEYAEEREQFITHLPQRVMGWVQWHRPHLWARLFNCHRITSAYPGEASVPLLHNVCKQCLPETHSDRTVYEISLLHPTGENPGSTSCVSFKKKKNEGFLTNKHTYTTSAMHRSALSLRHHSRRVGSCQAVKERVGIGYDKTGRNLGKYPNKSLVESFHKNSKAEEKKRAT